MLPWLEVSVAFIAITSAFDLYLSWRQLRRYIEDKHVPHKLKELVTQQQFNESCAYQRESMQLKMVQAVIDLGITLASIALRIYPAIWSYVEVHVGVDAHEYWKSLAFIAITHVINELFSLPFALYSDFVIEERHGFNKKTLAIFFSDMIKGTAIAAVIGAPLMAVVIKLVRWAGPTCYLWLWGFLLLFSLLMTFIVPVVIMPLFNKFESVQDEVLKGKIGQLAARTKYPLKKLYQMDGSKRSGHSNAFLYGFWKNKRIVLFDTILKHDHTEIVAIIGHELGHWKFNHMLKTLIFGSLVLFVQLYLFKEVVFRPEPFRSFGFKDESVVIGLFILSLILSPINVILGLISTYVSRVHEFQADRYAKDLGYGQDLGRALVAVGIDNKMTYNPDPLYAACKYSHPTLLERLEALNYSVDKKKQ